MVTQDLNVKFLVAKVGWKKYDKTICTVKPNFWKSGIYYATKIFSCNYSITSQMKPSVLWNVGN